MTRQRTVLEDAAEMGSDSGEEFQLLLVVDLEGARSLRGLTRNYALKTVRRATAARDRRPHSKVAVLLHGDGKESFLALGAEVLQPVDVLDQAGMQENYRWVDEVARELTFGSGHNLFPSALGIHLGELGFLGIQGGLYEFAVVAGSAASVATTRRVRECRVISSDPERARCLAEMLRSQVPKVTRWSPPHVRVLQMIMRPLRRLQELRGRSSSRTTPSVPDLPGTEVLIVSESVPMAQMFEAVEPHLAAEGGPTVLRVQYGNSPPAIRANGRTSVAQLGRPLMLPPRRGRYLSQWRTVERAIPSLRISRPLFGAELAAPVRAILERLFHWSLDQMTEHLEYAHAALEATKPRLVVVGNDRWWVGLSYVLLSRIRGLPTMCVQDGMTADNMFWRWVAADRVLASSDDWARILREHGVASSRIEVIGQPRYDRLCKLRDTSNAQDARAALGLHVHAKYVVFATQPHQTVEFVERVVDAILAVPEVNLLLRPHPSEPAAKYEALMAARSSARLSQHGSKDIFQLLLASDTLVTEHSTVALEACVFGVPVVTVTFGGRPPLISYTELGVARGANNPAELTAVLGSILGSVDGPGHEQRRPDPAVLRAIGPVDGAAGWRAASQIRAAVRAPAVHS